MIGTQASRRQTCLALCLAAGLSGAAHAQPTPCNASVPVTTTADLGDDYTPLRLAARAQIEDRVRDWARAVDRRDWDLARDLFHPAAKINHGGPTTAARLIDELADRHRAVAMSAHHVTTIRVAFVNDDLALSEAYVLAVQRVTGPDGLARYAVTSGRYVDRFERRCGLWKIADRTTVHDGSGQFVLTSVAPPPNWVTGSRGFEDVAQAARRAMGLSVAAPPPSPAPLP